MLTTDQKQAWAETLRSGPYKQGMGQLKTFDAKYCCLGVFCEAVLGIDLEQPDPDSDSCTLGTNSGTEEDKFTQAPLMPLNEALERRTRRAVARMNDLGETFSAIADWIEENL